ncbi:MAG TPA: AEC family transporter [Oligoflexia bacterium]|nr:AEC family transporter [Oligoflexia bacterium]
MFEKVLAPYLLVAAGFAAGKILGLRKEAVAPLLIYFLTPVVVFAAVLRAPLEVRYIGLPAFFYLLCALVCWISFKLAQRPFGSPRSNLLGFACADANSGYFGIPVGIALFGENALSAIVLSSFGFILYENTIGFYLTARGKHTAQESLIKVLRLPSVYAFILGLVLNIFSLELHGPWLDLCTNIRGAYSVLGMMMIGLAIADLEKFSIDLPFLSYAFAFKFIFWPLLVGLVLVLDAQTASVFSLELRRVVFFMSTLPLAANVVAIAALLKVEPERAAVAVLASTLLALLTVPLTNAWFSGMVW